MKTIFYPIYVLLAIFLVGATACGTQSDGDNSEEVADICMDPAFFDFDENLYDIDFEPWLTEGSSTNYDSDLGFLVLGEHAGASEGPDDEPIGGITLIFDEPGFVAWREDGGSVVYNEEFASGEGWNKKCASKITSATLSTTDVRVGTGEELNGKLYSLVNPPTTSEPCKFSYEEDNRELEPGYIEFLYVSRDVAHGWFCVQVEQSSPDSGELHEVGGYFAISQ